MATTEGVSPELLVAGLSQNLGAAFVSLVIAAVLYGITILQTFTYLRRCTTDSRSVRSLVVILWVLDTLHLILSTMCIYSYFVTNWGRTEDLDRTTWTMNLQTDCNGLIALIVQCFFARRVWMMSKSFILTAVIVALSLVHFGLGIVFTVYAFALQRFSLFPHLLWVAATGLGSAAACDVLIAISMCYCLSQRRTGFQRTDSLITSLMLYSLNTGLLTSMLALIAVITFATMNNLIWLAAFWILGKCYVNSILAVLNSRERLRERATAQETSFVHLTPIHPSSAKMFRRASHIDPEKGTTSLAVMVETTRMVRTDYQDQSPTEFPLGRENRIKDAEDGDS